MRNTTNLSGVREIARRANVSIATVDRVLHKRSGVSAKTQKIIEDIILEMDYKPNILARRLASKRVYRYAVLIPQESAETEYWKAPLQGIERAWSEVHNYGVEVDFYLYNLNESLSFVAQSQQVLEQSYDGAIVAPSFTQEASLFFEQAKGKGMKCVFINSDIKEVSPLAYIGPDLFQSGKLAGNLCRYLIPEQAHILIINISKEIDAAHHLLSKVAGFHDYFRGAKLTTAIDTLSIHQTEYSNVGATIGAYLAAHPVDLIYVTNSRVYAVAQYLKEQELTHIKLIGYDYLAQNISYLEQEVIDFLICQKPMEQGYLALMALYDFHINEQRIEACQHMPIDILTKENYRYYTN